MNRVLIVGGGFAGLAALRKLAGSKLKLKISLIDKRKQAQFLPMLPDVLGRGITTDSLSYNFTDLAKRLNIDFVNEEVLSVDLENRQLATRKQAREYDYLLLASGSSTNFYGQEQIASARANDERIVLLVPFGKCQRPPQSPDQRIRLRRADHDHRPADFLTCIADRKRRPADPCKVRL